MEGQDYLNQISSSVRPDKKPKSNFLSSPIFKIILGGILALIVIIVIGSALTSGNTGIKSKSVSLKYHIDNTLEILDKYKPNIKSSNLRSSAASLKSVLSNTSHDLTEYITEAYKYKDKSDTFKKELSDADLARDALDASLFDAKINGVLDQVYANKLAYEISSIMSEEYSIYNSANNETLQNLLSTSYSSLKTLLPNFENYSAN